MSSPPRRFSVRRKAKTAKVLDQQQILNPLRNICPSEHNIPEPIIRQLRRLEYLNTDNLDTLMNNYIAQASQMNPEECLTKMKSAVCDQENKYTNFFNEKIHYEPHEQPTVELL